MTEVLPPGAFSLFLIALAHALPFSWSALFRTALSFTLLLSSGLSEDGSFQGSLPDCIAVLKTPIARQPSALPSTLAGTCPTL